MLLLFSEWFPKTWIMTFSLSSVNWGLFSIIFHVYDFYLIAILSLGEEVLLETGFYI